MTQQWRTASDLLRACFEAIEKGNLEESERFSFLAAEAEAAEIRLCEMRPGDPVSVN